MRAANVSQIRRHGVLLVTEKKRIGDVRVTQRREPRNIESRITALQPVGAVRARNFEVVQTIILFNIHILGT